MNAHSTRSYQVLAPPRASIRWLDRRLRGAYAAMLVAAAVACAFLPDSLTVRDEYFYAGQAFVLAHGRSLPVAGDPLELPGESPGAAFRYPMAWPSVLALARMISWRAMYVMSLIVHLLGAAAFARMLVRRQIASVAVVVYLFHPVLWIYSRTLMSDVPATAALLIAMDAWENRACLPLGAALGFATCARLTGFAPLLGFVCSVGRAFHARELLAIAVGVTGLSALQLWFNAHAHGSAFTSPYASSVLEYVSSASLLHNSALYLAGLMLLPPWSLAFSLWGRRCDRWAVLALIVTLAFLPVANYDRSARWLETLVGGQRYVIPAHVALAIATAGIWGRLALFQRSWLVLGLGALCGVTGAVAMARLEQRHRPAVEVVRACRPRVLAYDSYADRIAGSVVAAEYRAVSRPERLDPRWDVLILAPGVISNRPGYEASWHAGPPHFAGARCGLVGDYAIYDLKASCPAFERPCRP